MYLRCEHGGRVDDAAGPHHEAEVALLQVGVRGLQYGLLQTLPEPDHVRPQQPAAPSQPAARERGLGDEVRGCSGLGRAAASQRLAYRGVRVDGDGLAPRAPHLEQVPVQLEDVGGAGPGVEAVDVLRDHHQLAALGAEPLLGGRDGLVRGVGQLGGHQLAAVVVELPHEAGVGCEGCGRGEVLGLVAPPEAAGAAEGRDPALRGHAGPGEDDEVAGGGQEAAELGEVGGGSAGLPLLVLGCHVENAGS